MRSRLRPLVLPLAVAASFAAVSSQGPAAAPLAAADSTVQRSAAQAMSDSSRRPYALPPRPVRAAVSPTAVDTSAGPLVPADVPGFWRTRAERTAWHQSADYEETMRFCRQAEGGSRWVKLTSYGTSGQGRDLPLLIVSKDRAFTPEAARATGKPIVLIVNGIHSGEIEGKDASLALLRDMAVLRTRQELLDSCVVLVLPIFSVDAHERRSKYNRMNQNGPDEMGWRSTPVGLNLNRDWTKLEAPEMSALISNVYSKWWPDLLIDDHTTDGADYRHDVTYGFQNGGGCPAPLARWYAEAFEGRVVKRLAEQGHLPAPYLNFRRGSDPRTGIDFGWSPPRFSTGYAPLQARGAILVETHMLKPYGRRVKATYDLLADVLDEVRQRPGELKRAVRESEAGAVALARGRGSLVLASHTTDRAVPFAFKGKATSWQMSEITGGLVPHYADAPWDTTVSLYRETTPDLVVVVPPGYVVPREWTEALDVLRAHGIVTRRLARSWRDTVEMARVQDWAADADGFEGHHLLHVKKMQLERQARSFRAGDVWVPCDQRSGALVVNLLEAQAPDGLMAWNFFDTVLLKKEYGEDYVIEPLAKQMLTKDPALAKAFADRLAADSTFAHSPWARADFFYRRSPWADPEQDLVPVARALRAPPESVLEPQAAGAAETPARPTR